MIFQVTGLPRSGTGFIATFLNLQQNCICHHDLAAERDDWYAISDELEKEWPFVGEISTYGWLPKAARKRGPKVFIDRDPADVVQSMNEALGKTHDVGPYREAYLDLQDWVADNSAMVIPFERLFTPRCMFAIWEHVFGEARDFPMAKAELFVKMNIQRHEPEKMLGTAETARRRLFE